MLQTGFMRAVCWFEKNLSDASIPVSLCLNTSVCRLKCFIILQHGCISVNHTCAAPNLFADHRRDCFYSMGNLIKVLTRDIDNNGGNFFLDFESETHTHTDLCSRQAVQTFSLSSPFT